VKLSIQITPDLDRQLQAYAGAYKDTYGEDEKVADLVPFMLQKFLDGDRRFVQRAKSDRKGGRLSGRKDAREKGG
jgi:hypothetical protein